MKTRTSVVAIIEIVVGALLVSGAVFFGRIGAITIAAAFVLAAAVFILAGVGLLNKSKIAWYVLTVLLAIGTVGTLMLLLLASHANNLGDNAALLLFGSLFFLLPLILLLTDPPKRWRLPHTVEEGKKPG
jgi:hypothetical protein